MKEKALHAVAKPVVDAADAVKDADVTAAAEPAANATQAMLHNPETWIIVSFVLFVAIFIKLVLPAITKALDSRAETIRNQLEQASRLRAEAEALLADYQQKQQKMLAEAEALVATAKADADDIRARAAADLKLALARRTQQAEEKIARAEAEAIALIRRRMIETASTRAQELLSDPAHASQADTAALDRALAAIAGQV